MTTTTTMDQVPTVVSHVALVEAMRPVLALVGVSPEEVYTDPGVTVGDAVRFYVPHTDEMLERLADVRAATPAGVISSMLRATTVGEGPTGERAIEVTIPTNIKPLVV